MEEPPRTSPKRRYRWPWIVAIALIIWVLLIVVWMSHAVRQVREQRDFNAPSSSGPAR